MKKIFIGTSGYTYNHWKEKFYPSFLPQKEWLKHYCRHFKTVEINASFYHSLKAETYEKWRRDTPEDFVFFIKGHRFITGVKRLKDVDSSVDFFFTSVFGLKEKLAGVLWQFPQDFKMTADSMGRLNHFLGRLPEKILHAFEFRDQSWFIKIVYETLKKHNAALVCAESKRNLPEDNLTADFVYIRFHGPERLYSSLYSKSDLAKWAEKIKKWQKKHDVYVYFNNDADANSVKNAKELVELLK